MFNQSKSLVDYKNPKNPDCGKMSVIFNDKETFVFFYNYNFPNSLYSPKENLTVSFKLFNLEGIEKFLKDLSLDYLYSKFKDLNESMFEFSTKADLFERHVIKKIFIVSDDKKLNFSNAKIENPCDFLTTVFNNFIQAGNLFKVTLNFKDRKISHKDIIKFKFSYLELNNGTPDLFTLDVQIEGLTSFEVIHV